jgi:hypothetical protein
MSTVDPIRPSRERPLVANPSKMDSKCFGPGWAGDFVRAPHTSSTEQGWMVKGGIAASALAQAAKPGGGFPGDGNGSPPVGRRFNRPRMVSTDRLSAGAGVQAVEARARRRRRRSCGTGRCVDRYPCTRRAAWCRCAFRREGVGGGRDVTWCRRAFKRAAGGGGRERVRDAGVGLAAAVRGATRAVPLHACAWCQRGPVHGAAVRPPR